MDVTVTITGTSPNYTVTPSPAGPYTGSIDVTFQNDTTAGVTVYYKAANSALTQSQNIGTGSAGSPVPSGAGNLEYNVVAEGAANPIAWSHVIHVGSGLPGARHEHR